MRSEAFILLFSTILLHDAFSKDVPDIVATPCYKSNFDYPYNSCTLKCSLDLTDTDYLADGYQFSYYSDDSSVNVNVSNVGDNDIDVDYSYKNNQVELTLDLMNSKYYAGVYMCWMHLTNINGGSQEVSHTFSPIDSTNPGVPLGSKCNDEHECWALNAKCTVVCQCPSDSVIYNGKNDTPACLGPSYDSCIVDDQCSNYHSSNNYHCVDSMCTYIDDDDYDSGLSTGEIVGIAIGGVAFLLLMILPVYCQRRRMKKFWKTHRVVGVAAAVVVIEDIGDKDKK